MDPRTRLMLFKLLSSGFIELIDGCLSTGKEANVYYAKAGDKAPAGSPADFAVKVFKTSILGESPVEPPTQRLRFEQARPRTRREGNERTARTTHPTIVVVPSRVL